MTTAEHSMKHVLLMHMNAVSEGLVTDQSKAGLRRAVAARLKAIIHRLYDDSAELERFAQGVSEADRETGSELEEDEEEVSAPVQLVSSFREASAERSHSEARSVEFQVNLRT